MWIRDKLLGEWAMVDDRGHVEWAAKHLRTKFVGIEEALRAAVDLASAGPCHPVFVRVKRLREWSKYVIHGTAGDGHVVLPDGAKTVAWDALRDWAVRLDPGTRVTLTFRAFKPEP